MTDGEGLIINGRRVPVPGVRIVSWLDDPRVPRVTKVSRRRGPVTAVVLHTSRGKVGAVREGAGDDGKALRLARYQARSTREASWHLTIGGAGTVYQQADIAEDATWHASQANFWSVGIECAQSSDTPDLTRAQVDACVAVVRAICEAFNIPQRVPVRSHDGGSWSVEARPVRAWQPRKQGGESRPVAGVIGHRNLTTNRGAGDPGDPLMLALLAAGFAGASPAEMTVGTVRHADDAPVAEPEDTHDEDSDDAPAAPPLPSWLDPALEVDASRDLPDDLAAFVRAQWAVLAGQGLAAEQAAEFLAHAATECGRGRRAFAFNMFGAKLREREYAEAVAKTGRGLRWWRDLGHVESGDDEVELYRGFDDAPTAWRWFAKKTAPRYPNSADRYAAAGRAFHSDDPSGWFIAILAAGYRGARRAAEIAALRDPETHPSVVAHRKLVARVRELMR